MKIIVDEYVTVADKAPPGTRFLIYGHARPRKYWFAWETGKSDPKWQPNVQKEPHAHLARAALMMRNHVLCEHITASILDLGGDLLAEWTNGHDMKMRALQLYLAPVGKD
jgi:hypothetical protein